RHPMMSLGSRGGREGSHFPKRDRLRGVTTIKCASHPRTMFFNGLATSPSNKRPRLPGPRSIAAPGVSGSADGTAVLCPIVFYDLLGGAQDLDLHALASQRPLEFSDLGIGLAQLAGRHHVLTGLHCRRC